MKYLFIALLLPSIAAAQGNGYASIYGGVSHHENTKGIFNLSVGLLSGDAVGVGAGVGYVQYDKPYIPLTADISFFGKSGKISPLIIGKAGYGVYNSMSTRGGFTASGYLGISIPVGKTKALLMAGYSTYTFTMRSHSTRDNRLSFCLGMKI